jgi:glycosyltransferase involved in cell wall biosynthesis
LKLAGIKTVVMPYGSDIQVLDKSKNLYFKQCMIADYPLHKKKYQKIKLRIQLWTKNADFIISGCEWVDYMYHWDKLMLGHFSIDMRIIDSYLLSDEKSFESLNGCKTFKILHAPNHRNQKGTNFIISAINDLKSEGFNIELTLAEKKSNSEILKLINQSDLIIDQLVIGWYAMFSIEAMALGKPVVCYLRDDLISLYKNSGLISEDELPIINASPETIKNVIKDSLLGKINLNKFSEKGRTFIEKNHSLAAVGRVFYEANKKIGIEPALKELSI